MTSPFPGGSSPGGRASTGIFPDGQVNGGPFEALHTIVGAATDGAGLAACTFLTGGLTVAFRGSDYSGASWFTGSGVSDSSSPVMLLQSDGSNLDAAYMSGLTGFTGWQIDRVTATGHSHLSGAGADDVHTQTGFRAVRRSDDSWAAVYFPPGTEPHDYYLQTWSAGGGYSAPIALGAAATSSGTIVSAPTSLVLDASDNAHVVWWDGATRTLKHRVLTPGGSLGAIGTWETGLVTFKEQVGVGCAYGGGIVLPYIRDDGCFRMAYWPADTTTSVPAISALPQAISPATVVSGGIPQYPGCLAAYSSRLWCFHRIVAASTFSAGRLGVATYDGDSQTWTGSRTDWNSDVSLSSVCANANYLPTIDLVGVLFGGYFEYYTEPVGGYPARVDYGCAPNRARAWAFVVGD